MTAETKEKHSKREMVCAQAPMDENVETWEVLLANAEEMHGDEGTEDPVQQGTLGQVSQRTLGGRLRDLNSI